MESKITVVTGGSKGIGKQICQKFAENGYRVIFIYDKDDAAAGSTLKMLQAINPENQMYKVDVSHFDEIQKVFNRINEEYSAISILINCAGITKDKTAKKMVEQIWDDVIDVNLKGVFNCSKAVLEPMCSNNYGRIINISSVVAFTGNFGQCNYASSKAGVIGLTKSLALETAKYNITVNAVAPGFINTDMTRNIPEEILARTIENIPKKRLGLPEEIADFVYFISTLKTDYITGQVFHINGGLYM